MSSVPPRNRQNDQTSFDSNRRTKKTKDKRPDKANNKKNNFNGKPKKIRKRKKKHAQRNQPQEAMIPSEELCGDHFDQSSVSTSTSPMSDEKNDFESIDLLELDAPKLFKSPKNEDLVWRSVGGKRKKGCDAKSEKKAKLSWVQESNPHQRGHRQSQTPVSQAQRRDHNLGAKRNDNTIRVRHPNSRSNRSGGRTRPPIPHKRNSNATPPLNIFANRRRMVGHSSSSSSEYRPKQHNDQTHSKHARSASPWNDPSRRSRLRGYAYHPRDRSRSRSPPNRERTHNSHASARPRPSAAPCSRSVSPGVGSTSTNSKTTTTTDDIDGRSSSERNDGDQSRDDTSSFSREDSAATTRSSSSVSRADDEGEEDDNPPSFISNKEALRMNLSVPADEKKTKGTTTTESTTRYHHHDKDKLGSPHPECPHITPKQEKDTTSPEEEDSSNHAPTKTVVSSSSTLDPPRTSSARKPIRVTKTFQKSEERNHSKRISSIMCPSPSASPSTSPCVSPDMGSQPSFHAYPAFMIEPPAYRAMHSQPQRWPYMYNGGQPYYHGPYYPTYPMRHPPSPFYYPEETPRRSNRPFVFRHILDDSDNKCVARYCPSVFEPRLLKRWYETIYDRAQWTHHETFNPRFNNRLPRLVAWYTDHPCACRYSYSGVDCAPNATPDWLRQIQRMVFESARITVGDNPDSCNINLYRNGMDCAGWHQDDEDLFDSLENQCLIVSFSLGVGRFFEFRKMNSDWNQQSNQIQRQYLSEGDVMTMEGYFQKYYQHRVPADDNDDSRINLTWRWIQKHESTCPKHCSKRK